MPDLLPEPPVEIQVVACSMPRALNSQICSEQRLGLPTYASVVGLSKAGHGEVWCSMSSQHSRMGTVHGSFACWVFAQRIQAFTQSFPQLLSPAFGARRGQALLRTMQISVVPSAPLWTAMSASAIQPKS